MNPAEAAAAYAALYAPTIDDLRRQLLAVGEALETEIAEAHRAPTMERCDRLGQTLTGAQIAVRKLREALAREGGPQ